MEQPSIENLPPAPEEPKLPEAGSEAKPEEIIKPEIEIPQEEKTPEIELNTTPGEPEQEEVKAEAPAKEKKGWLTSLFGSKEEEKN